MNMVKQFVQQVRIGVRRLGQGLPTRSFVRHVGVLTSANGVGAVLSFVQGILVARWLGAELYGVAALVMSGPALVYTFLDTRSAEASIKYLSEFHTRGEREQAVGVCWLGYAIDFAVASIALAVVVALAPWVSRAVVHRPEAAWLVVLYGSAFLPRALVGTSYAVLASLGAFPTLAVLRVAETIVRVSLVLGLVLAGWGVAGVIWGNAAAMALAGVIYSVPAFILIRRTWGMLPWTASWDMLKGHRREIVNFLAYNDLNALLGMIPKQLDVMLLGYFRNPTEVGYYKLAKSVAGTVGYLVEPLQAATYPELARLWAIRSWDAVRAEVRHLAPRIGAPAGASAPAGALLLPWLLPALVGEVYRPAILATQILLVGSGVWLAFFWLRPAFMALGEVRAWLYLSCIGMIILVPGMAISAAVWGFQGLAGWMAASQLWGHSMFAAWLIWRWSAKRTVTGGQLS